MRNWFNVAAAATAVTLLATGTRGHASEIALMTTGAVEYIMRDLIPPFESVSGHKVTMTVLGTGPAVTKIKEGTFADLILLGPDALNELAAAGKVDIGTSKPVFNSRIGLAVKTGTEKPDIRTSESLKNALLNAKSIGFSIGPSGEHFSKVIIEKLGIAAAVRPKMTNVRGAPVGTGCAKGDVEICIHQIAELQPIAGIDVIGDLPAELNKTIVYATGLTTMVKQPEAAKALVNHLMLPGSASAIRKNGMEPVSR